MLPLGFGVFAMTSGPENSALFLHRIGVWLPPFVTQLRIIIDALLIMLRKLLFRQLLHLC